MSVQIQKKHFTVSEYYMMAEAGLFSEDDRVELIEGEIFEMSPIGSSHAACVNRLNRIFNRKVSRSAIISVQNPLRLNDFSEPEPDLVLLKPRKDFYARTHPTPADALLVIEVADTSAEYDRNVKIPLYARAEIAETWLINLPKDTIEIYSQPKNGKYQKVQRFKRSKSFTSPVFPNISLKVDDILG
jgi:Uma2 family endonuclease